MMPELSPIFIFCHVPKTAGTSLITALKSSFGIHNSYIQASPLDEGFLQHIDECTRSEPAFFAGHVPLPRLIALKKRVRRNVILVGCVRDTLDHFCSLYLHNSMLNKHSEFERKSLPLRNFLSSYDDSKVFDCSVINVVTRYLSGKLSGKITPANYRQALRSLGELDFIFDSSALHEDLDRFCFLYGVSRPQLLRLNSNVFSRKKYGEVQRCSDILYPLLRFDNRILIIARRRKQGVDTGRHKIMNYELKTDLSETMRRVKHLIWAEPEMFEFDGSDILLHPPRSGVTKISAYGIPLDNTTSSVLRFGFSLPHLAAGQVALKLCVGDGRRTIEYRLIAKPGDLLNVEISLAGLGGLLDVSLASEMVPQRGKNDFAWAKVLKPEIDHYGNA